MPTHKFSHPIGWLFFYSLKGMLKMCRPHKCYEQTSPLDVPSYAFGISLSILRIFSYPLIFMLKMCRPHKCYEQTSPLDVPLYAFGISLSILRIFSYPLVLCLKCADHFVMYKHHHSAFLSFANVKGTAYSNQKQSLSQNL